MFFILRSGNIILLPHKCGITGMACSKLHRSTYYPLSISQAKLNLVRVQNSVCTVHTQYSFATEISVLFAAKHAHKQWRNWKFAHSNAYFYAYCAVVSYRLEKKFSYKKIYMRWHAICHTQIRIERRQALLHRIRHSVRFYQQA